MTSVALYARATDRLLTEEQLNLLRGHADDKGWEVAREFLDAGTGTNSDRPGYLDLVQFVLSKHPDVVLAFSPDRLTRRPAELARLAADGARLEFLR